MHGKTQFVFASTNTTMAALPEIMTFSAYPLLDYDGDDFDTAHFMGMPLW